MIIDQEEDDVDKAPAQGYPAMPVTPRRALPISRAGGRPKGGGRGRHLKFEEHLT